MSWGSSCHVVGRIDSNRGLLPAFVFLMLKSKRRGIHVSTGTISGITEKDPRLLGLIRSNIVHKPLLLSYGIGDITRDYNGIFFYYKALKGL